MPPGRSERTQAGPRTAAREGGEGRAPTVLFSEAAQSDPGPKPKFVLTRATQLGEKQPERRRLALLHV